VVRYDQLADRWLVVMPIFRRLPFKRNDPPGKGGGPVQVSLRGVDGQPGAAQALHRPTAEETRRAGGGGRPGRRGEGSYAICYAVSTSPDPLGAYYRYMFERPLFPDYPRPAVWPDGYYVTTSTGDDIIQKHVYVAERAKMLKGEDAAEQGFVLDDVNFLLPADLDGRRLPPAGAPALLMAAGGAQLKKVLKDDGIYWWEFAVDWQDPSKSKLVGPRKVRVAPYEYLGGGQLTRTVPQPGTAQKLDVQGDKLMARLVYRRVGDREALVAAQAVRTAAGGGGVRWYEFRLDGRRDVRLHQQGTYAPDGSFRWMPSPALDARGNIGIGYSFGGTPHYPGQRFVGRLADDPPGVLTMKEAVLAEGKASQSSTYRWQDYTQTASPATARGIGRPSFELLNDREKVAGVCRVQHSFMQLHNSGSWVAELLDAPKVPHLQGISAQTSALMQAPKDHDFRSPSQDCLPATTRPAETNCVQLSHIVLEHCKEPAVSQAAIPKFCFFAGQLPLAGVASADTGLVAVPGPPFFSGHSNDSPMFADAWTNLATSALAWGMLPAALAGGFALWMWLRAKKLSPGKGPEPAHPGVHAVTPAPEPEYFQEAKRQFDRHVAQAEGSDFERAGIAAAMCELEHERVEAQRAQLSKADQLVFMMTYECAAMWCIRHGMEDLLKPEATESAVSAMERHFAEHAWYQPEPFQRIWHQMQAFIASGADDRQGRIAALSACRNAARSAGGRVLVRHGKAHGPCTRDARGSGARQAHWLRAVLVEAFSQRRAATLQPVDREQCGTPGVAPWLGLPGLLCFAFSPQRPGANLQPKARANEP
jgi:hypothetical protein